MVRGRFNVDKRLRLARGIWGACHGYLLGNREGQREKAGIRAEKMARNGGSPASYRGSAAAVRGRWVSWDSLGTSVGLWFFGGLLE